jgi:hypothetical protein
MDDFYGRKPDNAHDNRDSTQRKGHNETPDLPSAELQLIQKRKRQREDWYSGISNSGCKKAESCNLLNTSVVTLVAQSIRKTSFELNVLQAPSSGDH